MESIDKNFKVNTKIQKRGLVFRNCLSEPFSLHGFFYDDGNFRRMDKETAKNTSDGVYILHTQCAGGRIKFKTDSPFVAVNAELSCAGKMSTFAFTGSAGFDIYADGIYYGTIIPAVDVETEIEGLVDIPSDGVKEIVVNCPTYSGITELNIGLKENCVLEKTDGYKISKPVVFYGSSITQGGCVSRPGCTYEEILSRTFDFDYINLGFSGNAKGEKIMAEYIAGLDMSVFIYDYDHNANTADDLLATHEPMFKIIRNANPDLPVIMLSRPKYHLTEDETERMNIVKQTYLNAVANGDKNVYFIAGNTLIKDEFAEISLVDNCHPNDVGFVSMAQTITPVLQKIFAEKNYGI